MKIVHMTTVHHPFDNRIFHKECISIVEKSYSAVLIARHEQDETIQGVIIRALPEPKGRLQRIFFTARQAYKKALNEDAEIYHIHDPELIVYALLLRIRGKKVVYDIHEDYFSAIKQKTYLVKPIRTAVAYFFAALENILTKPLARVVAEKYYRERFPDSTEVLNYPRRELLKYSIRQDNPDGLMRLIYTGNITVDRGALIHAGLVNALDDIQVYLVGYCRRDLAEKLYGIAGKNRDRLFIEGIEKFVPFENIVDYYARGHWTAGLALFPGSMHYMKKELTKFFEYMSAGIPVVCSDFPAWKRLIEQTGAGVCVNVEDEKEIREAICSLDRDRDQAHKMSTAGRRNVEKYYNWENEAAKLISLYHQLARES